MFSFIGYKCPVCGKPFAEGDDIVVCPDCGAPYHRECYHKLGRCQFESLHSPSFVWEPSPQEEEAAKAEITLEEAAAMAQELVDGGRKASDACKEIAAKTKFSKSEIYRKLLS